MATRKSRVIEDMQTAKEQKVHVNEYHIRIYANDDVYLEKVKAARVSVVERSIILYDRSEKIVAIFPTACSTLMKY